MATTPRSEQEKFDRELASYYHRYAPTAVALPQSEIDDFRREQLARLSFLPAIGASATSSVPELSARPRINYSFFYPPEPMSTPKKRDPAKSDTLDVKPPSYEESEEEEEMREIRKEVDAMMRGAPSRDAPSRDAPSRDAPSRDAPAGQQGISIADLHRRRDELRIQ